MLNLEKLRAVKTIVCHQNGVDQPCPDGVASALLLRDVLPEATVLFVSYDQLDALAALPNMLWCDIAPSPKRAAEFVAAGAIVLDHHRTARSVVEAFGENGVFADENAEAGVSGAVLAYRHVWTPLATAYHLGASESVRHFARLAGVRDTWQRGSSYWDEACAQAAALVFWPWEKWPLGFRAYSTGYQEMMEIGPVLVERRLVETKRFAKEGWRFLTPKGTRVLVVATRETSDVAEEVGEEFDLVVGFSFFFERPGPRSYGKMIVSTRSHTTFDCAALAKTHGGGGHTRAAGFSLDLGAEDLQPYSLLAELVGTWERTGSVCPPRVRPL